MKKGKKPLFAETALNAFILALRSDAFKESFDISRSRASDIFKWIVSREDENSKVIKDLMLQKNKARKVTTFRSMFKEGPPELLEIGTEQNRQILKLAVALVLYTLKDQRVSQVYDSTFRDRLAGLSFLIGSKYIPSKCARYKTNKESKFDTKVPKIFEILVYFHALRYYVQKRNDTGSEHRLAGRQDFRTGNRIGFAVQIVVNAWSSLARAIQLENCEAMISPYIMFDISTSQFRVLSNRTNGLAPLSQMQTYQENDKPATCQEDSNPNAWGRSDDADSSFRYLAKTFFEHIHDLVLHDELYELADNEEWKVIDKYRFRKTEVASVFSSLPVDVLNGLGYNPKCDAIDVDAIHSETCKGTEHSKKRTLGEDERGERQENSRSERKKWRRTETGKDLKLYQPTNPRVMKQEDTTVSTTVDGRQAELLVPLRKDDCFEGLAKTDIADMKAEAMKAMRPVCRVHDVCFRELVETDAAEIGSYLHGSVQLIITDPPQSLRKNRNKKRIADVLTKEDMEECVDMFADILKPGGHGIVFCSALQFRTWHNLLTSYSTYDTDGSDNDSSGNSRKESGDMQRKREKESERKRRFLFSVEDVPLYFVQAPGQHLKKKGGTTRHHVSVVEMAIHFWKREFLLKEEQLKQDESSQGYIQSRHAPCTNCIDEINPIGRSERVRVPNTEGSRFKHLRLEQKSIRLLQELVGRYTKPGDIVVDCFAGTLVAAKACLQMEKHRIFIGCDRDSQCVEDAMPFLLKVFLDEARNSKSDLSLSQEEHISLLRYIEKLDDCEKKDKPFKNDAWNAPPGLPMYQRLPPHMRRFLSCITNDTSFYLEQKRGNENRWFRETPPILETIPTEVLLGVEAAAKSFIVTKSTIRHQNAGKGVFATRTIAKNEEILTYYGTVVYSDLGLEKAENKSYGNGVLGIRKGHFRNRAIELKSHALDSNGVKHKVFIVPAQFCVASYINDPRYLPGDEEESMHQKENRRAPNVRFLENTTGDRASRSKLGSHRLVCIEALRQIRIGEEIFVDYGAEFTNWSSN